MKIDYFKINLCHISVIIGLLFIVIKFDICSNVQKLMLEFENIFFYITVSQRFQL
jgi:hypothetical protein